MVRELKMKIMPTGPEDYISRFCSGLGLDAEVEAKAYELIKAAQEKELTSGRGPTGIAASIIYIASVLCGKRRTQREVAEVAGAGAQLFDLKSKALENLSKAVWNFGAGVLFET